MLKILVKTSLLMLRSMTKMLMLLIMEDSNSRSKMDQNSDSRAIAKAKEAPRVINEEKVVRNHVVTVEPTIQLVSVQHMEKTFQCLLLIWQEQPTAWLYTLKRT